MINYDTIVIVDREIQEKVELYRGFLERSEFGTFFEDVCFVSEDSADGLPSAGLHSVKHCLFLRGLLNCDGYEKYYSEIEARRKENPNINYYMLFCQDKFCACARSERADGSVKKTFSIGIVEDDGLGQGEEEDLLRGDIRALKLLSMAMAVYVCNKGTSTLSFDNYYVTASVELNIQNIYFAIMRKLSVYADEINVKKAQVESNETVIEQLKCIEPKICEGNFPEDRFENFLIELGSFSDYKDMEKLRCKMEFEYDRADKAIRDSISKKVEIARKAEAVAGEATLMTCEKDEITHTMSITEKEVDFKGYMKTRPAGNEIVPAPEDVLKIVENRNKFDAQKIRNLLPLAREIDKSKQEIGGKVFLTSFLISMIFIVCVGAVYFARYLKFGLDGATGSDVVSLVAAPAALVLLSGLMALLAYVLIIISRKSVFEDVYKRLVEFFRNIPIWCEEVRKYINKYLTVYYNYHVKNAEISRLEELNNMLEKEIGQIREKAYSINEIAETVCNLAGDDFEKPDVSFASNRQEYKSSAVAFETKIRQAEKTDVLRRNNSVETPCPWLKKIVYETGNINGGVQ